MRTESFQPSRHGFAFADALPDRGPSFGLGAPLASAFGLGAGMAWVALDRNLAGRPIPSATELPPETDPLYSELLERQSNALAVAPWRRLVEWQSLPDCGRLGRAGLAQLSRAEWQKAQRSLDAGVPVLLFLILASGRHANPSLNKAVLAVGYELDRRARRVTIRVYDPARPANDGVRVVFRLGGRFVPLAARLAVDTEVRGFFTVPYDRPVPASLEIGVASDLDNRVMDSVIAILRADRTGDPLDVLGREGSGALLHLRRSHRGRWSAAKLNGGSRGEPTRNNPVDGVTVVGANRVFARTGTGELLEFRRLPVLGWRARSLTKARGAGDSFRTDSDPALLRHRRGRITAVACRNGKLVRYRSGPWNGWSADQLVEGSLAKTTFQGTPALAELARGVVHVLCRTDSGELLHVRARSKVGCVVENVTTRAGGRDRFAVSQDPITLTDRAGKVLNVVARSADGGVLLFRWTERKGWRGVSLSTAAVRAGGVELRCANSRMAATLDSDGTVHVVARDTRGGLIHLWYTRSGAAGGEEITRANTAAAVIGSNAGAPFIAAGPDGGLNIIARQGTELLLFRWAPVSGWKMENVSREQHASSSIDVCGDPAVILTERAAHAVFVDTSGRVHHLCAQSRRSSPLTDLRRRALAIAADVAAVPLGLVTSLKTHTASIAGLLGRPSRAAAGLGSAVPVAGGRGGSGIGARFLPSGARNAVLNRPSARATPKKATPAPSSQSAPRVEMHNSAAPVGVESSKDNLPAREELATSTTVFTAPCAKEPTLPAEAASSGANAPEDAAPVTPMPPAEPVTAAPMAGGLELTLTPAPLLPPELEPEPAKPASPPPPPPAAPTTVPPRAKRSNPALEGLPLLGEGNASQSVATSKPPIEHPSTTVSPPANRKKSRERDLLEMHRVMALAEEAPPELLPTLGGK